MGTTKLVSKQLWSSNDIPWPFCYSLSDISIS